MQKLEIPTKFHNRDRQTAKKNLKEIYSFIEIVHPQKRNRHLKKKHRLGRFRGSAKSVIKSLSIHHDDNCQLYALPYPIMKYGIQN